MKCYCCDNELIWNNDHTYEDLGKEGDGIVTILHYPSEECNVEMVEVYQNNEPKN
jgi:hypothetical protein